MALEIAADIGGTFTDFTVRETSSGSMASFKLLTTYPDRALGLLQGIDRAVGMGDLGHGSLVGYERIARFAHGSTVATNALVELNGARCGLLTTRGFKDLLELRRQKRPNLYDLQADKPVPLVPRALRKEITERVLATGSVLVPLDEDEVAAAAEELAAADVEAIAITFLNAYANPAHEMRAKEVIGAAFPRLAVYASTEVSPQFREFERLSTTVVNAFVGPPIGRYLKELGRALSEGGAPIEPLVMKGDAGVATANEASAMAVSTIGSGPAGGVMGAHLAAAEAGINDDLITFDMGGTSTDVSLVVGGRPLMIDQRSVAGWPIRGTALSVESIGAGGGSIAWVDEGGLLKVGPRSAGSTPGPACYGRGGTLPTITDANLVLGRLESLLAGEFPLRRDLAVTAIERAVAKPLEISVSAAAHGILAVATAHMEQAIRLVTVEQGFDPREFVLVAYGGAGALHAPLVANNLSIGRVLVPVNSGVLSSRGILDAKMAREFTMTRVIGALTTNEAEILGVLARLRETAASWALAQAKDAGRFADGGRPPEGEARTSVELAVDMRCAGQNYELTVPMPARSEVGGLANALSDAFHGLHERTYGYAFRGAALECVTFRARAGLEVGSGSTRPHTESPTSRAAPVPAGSREVSWHLDDTPTPTPVFAHLTPGAVVAGPALIETADATVAVWPGKQVEALSSGALLISALAEEGAR